MCACAPAPACVRVYVLVCVLAVRHLINDIHLERLVIDRTKHFKLDWNELQANQVLVDFLNRKRQFHEFLHEVCLELCFIR